MSKEEKKKKLPELKLGVEAKDKVTGFSGIVTSDTEFLTGCRQYGLQPKATADNDVKESRGFDGPRLEVIGWGIVPEEVQDKDIKGGPEKRLPRKA